MKKISKSFFDFIRSHKWWSGIGLLLIIVFVWYGFGRGPEIKKYTEAIVNQGSVTEIVSVTGKVSPLTEVDLAFEKGGRVSEISVNVGDQVFAGQYLASVSNADLLANLDQAKASLKKARASFGDNTLKTNLNFSQAENSLINAIRDSYTKADDAVRNKIFSLFNNPNHYRASLAFLTDAFLDEDIEEGKDEVVDILEAWDRALSKATSTFAVEPFYQTANANLLTVKKLLDECAEAVNGLTTDDASLTQLQIDSWKSNISVARTNINTAIDTLTDSYDLYKTTSLAVQTSKNTDLVEEATIEQAEATVAGAEAELAKTIIRSPLNGVITKVEAKQGEIVSANTGLISIISYGQYQVESFVPEADIAKVQMDNTARITLDAYGDNIIFDAIVTDIDPAATVIDGVPTYKVTLRFITSDERIRAGMTANLDILTNKKDNVLLLPSRMIFSREGEKYVSIIDPNDQNKIIEKKIVTGLRGSDGNTEIVSGLALDEKVVIAQ